MGRGITETLFLFLNLILDIMFAVTRSNRGEILIATGLAGIGGNCCIGFKPFSATLYLHTKHFSNSNLQSFISIAFCYSFIVLLLCSINISKLLEDLQPFRRASLKS